MNLQRPTPKTLQLDGASGPKLIDAVTATTSGPTTASHGVSIDQAIAVRLGARVQASDTVKTASLRVWVYMPSAGKWFAYTTLTLNKHAISGEAGENIAIDLALCGYSRMALSVAAIDAGVTLTVWGEKVVNQ